MTIACLEANEHCAGEVEYRMPLSETGRSFPRCEHHWALRLVVQERINATYFPGCVDPADAGERWEES